MRVTVASGTYIGSHRDLPYTCIGYRIYIGQRGRAAPRPRTGGYIGSVRRQLHSVAHTFGVAHTDAEYGDGGAGGAAHWRGGGLGGG